MIGFMPYRQGDIVRFVSGSRKGQTDFIQEFCLDMCKYSTVHSAWHTHAELELVTPASLETYNKMFSLFDEDSEGV